MRIYDMSAEKQYKRQRDILNVTYILEISNSQSELIWKMEMRKDTVFKFQYRPINIIQYELESKSMGKQLTILRDLCKQAITQIVIVVPVREENRAD